MRRYGPVPQPARRLKEAAILYAAELEADADVPTLRRAWDRLRKAADRYAASERHPGRPRVDA